MRYSNNQVGPQTVVHPKEVHPKEDVRQEFHIHLHDKISVISDKIHMR